MARYHGFDRRLGKAGRDENYFALKGARHLINTLIYTLADKV